MKNILLFILMMNVMLLQAQVIKGKVVDAETQESIPGVNIYLPEIKKGVVTDLAGNYSLQLHRAGSYKLQASIIGYNIVLKTVLVEADTLQVDFKLTHAVIETKEFIVSSVYHNSQDENPVDVIQFDQTQLQQATAPTLMEALTNVAGVNMIATGTNIGKPVIRGLSYNRVLVFSEGIPIDNQQFGDEHGLGLGEIGIDKVEIIKGPSSLLYGADAMGGVLHFVEERPANINTVVGDVGTKYFSNTNGYVINLGLKGTKDNFRFKLRGGYSSHGDYLQGNGERVTNTRYTESAFKASVGYMKKWWSGDVNYSFLQSSIGIPEEIGEQNTNRTLLEPFQLITNHILSSQNTIYIKKSHIKLNVGYLSNNRQEFEAGGLQQAFYHDIIDTAALDMLLQTVNYDVKWHLPEWKRIEVIIGAQGKYQTNANSGEENLIPDAEVQQVGGFGMLKYAKDKLSVISGVRYDVKRIHGDQMLTFGEEGFKRAFKQHYESINGSFGLTYKWTDKYLTRLNVASGFRAPNLAELSSNGIHEGTFRYEIGNLTLKTEQNVELDFGVEYIDEHVSLTFSAFNNVINNYIFLAPTDTIIDDAAVFTYEQTDANLYGFEATVDIHPHNMHWLHFETQYAMVIGEKSNGTALPRIPANNLLVTLKAEVKDFSWMKNPYVSVAGNTFFDQTSITSFETTTPGYTLLSAKVGGDLQLGKQKVILSLGVTNILNQRYYNHLSRLKADGIYNMGRNVIVNLKVPFGIWKK
ncbi:MAG: TonB-dependent receptor [Vicingus serpentipes]|nr:TonB-dependent receptor [Vicingus serpentipes]